MYQQDWYDSIRWNAVLLGVALAITLQILVTFLIIIPLNLSFDWSAVALVEGCIAAGAFICAWQARGAALINSVTSAMLCATISLIMTTVRAPADLNLWSIIFLFGTFGIVGALSGLLAQRMFTSRAEFSSTRSPVSYVRK
jgi:hypothetical protein